MCIRDRYNLNENDHWQADQNPVKWGQDRQTGSRPLIQENPFEEIEIASNACLLYTSSRDGCGADAFADASFVAVCLGGVDQTVTETDGFSRCV